MFTRITLALSLAVAAHAQQSHDHVFSPDGRWHCPAAMRAGEVLVPKIVGAGQLTAVLDDRERPVAGWHGGYTADEDGDWTLVLTGAPGARCRLELRRSEVALADDEGAFECEVPADGLQLVRARVSPGAYAFACDVTAGALTIDLRDLDSLGQPPFRWLGNLNKNGRYRQWMLVDRPFVAEIAARNQQQVPARAVGHLAKSARRVTFGERIETDLPLGDGQLFTMQLRAGDLVRIAVDSRAFDARFDLWDPTGAVSSFDDVGPLRLDARHTFLATRPGWYRILVFSQGGVGSGAFRLLVDRVRLPG